MPRKFDFEKIHPNHKLAFLDGVLTGWAILWVANMFRSAAKKN